MTETQSQRQGVYVIFQPICTQLLPSATADDIEVLRALLHASVQDEPRDCLLHQSDVTSSSQRSVSGVPEAVSEVRV